MMDEVERQIRQAIFDKVRELHRHRRSKEAFVPGRSRVPYAGRVFDEQEIIALVDASLDFWLTEGRFAAQFREALARYFGVRYALLTNSGSSANLLALSALTSPKLGERQLRPGDEVITVAAAFPTTVNPIVQSGLVPVFVDVELGTYNVIASQIEPTIGERTRAILMAHTLGNPFDLDAVMDIARRHDLFVIEDTCDAVGSTYAGRLVGTFGDIATVSFYPAHHITTGEGGAVLTNDGALSKILASFRDWGRDCWCEPGHDNTCGRRFDWQLGRLPYGYDHKFIYSHIGYNLKMTDMQAAIGVAQMEKLPAFVEQRKEHFGRLYEGLRSYQAHLILPQATSQSDPSWFGLPLTVRQGAPFGKGDLVRWLEDDQIATRPLFAGNILRHPAYDRVQYRVGGPLENTDRVMADTFWIGVYPGLTEEMISYMLASFSRFFQAR